MGFNFFMKNTLKNTRIQYVKDFKVEQEVKIEPCDKFVACLEKLSKNYVLALRDGANIETLQVANQNDIEFYEGYEITPNFTYDLRKQLSVNIHNVYGKISQIINLLQVLEDEENRYKDTLNDIKLDLNVVNNVLSNIYQNLTMTNDMPKKNQSDTVKNVLEKIKALIIEVVSTIIDISSKIIIDYITKQLDIIVYKIMNYYNQISEM